MLSNGSAAAPPAALGDLGQNEQAWQLLSQGTGPMHTPDLPAASQFAVVKMADIETADAHT
jgi:hypothetical protein